MREEYLPTIEEYAKFQIWSMHTEREIKKIFSGRVRELMVRFDISEKELAVWTGIGNDELRTFLGGDEFPPVEVLLRMSSFLRTSVSFLLGQ